DSGYNTQARFETNTANMKTAMNVFSRMIGLRALTDASRIAVLSVGADIIRVKLAGLQAVPKEKRFHVFNTGEGLTVEQYQALKELQQRGMYVELTLSEMESLIEKEYYALNEALDTSLVGVARSNHSVHGTQYSVLEDQFLTTLRNMTDSRIVIPQTANTPK